MLSDIEQEDWTPSVQGFDIVSAAKEVTEKYAKNFKPLNVSDLIKAMKTERNYPDTAQATMQD